MIKSDSGPDGFRECDEKVLFGVSGTGPGDLAVRVPAREN